MLQVLGLGQVLVLDALEALEAQLFEIVVDAQLARRLECGQEVFLELELEVAARGDLEGVLQRLRRGGGERQGGHFGAGLEVELLGLLLHRPVGVADDLGGLQADQDLAGVGVLARQVMDVVARRQRDVHLLGQVQQQRQHLLLLGQAVVMDLDEEVVLERLAVPARRRLGLLRLAAQQVVGDLALDAGRHDQQAVLVFFQQLLVDARLAVEALQERGGDQLAEVAVALVVAHQRQQVEVVQLVLAAVGAVEARARRQVELGADDGLDLALLGLLVEVDRAQDRAVVGQRHGGHLEGARLLEQVVDLQGGVEQAVLRVHVEVDEALHSHSMVAGGLEVTS